MDAPASAGAMPALTALTFSALGLASPTAAFRVYLAGHLQITSSGLLSGLTFRAVQGQAFGRAIGVFLFSSLSSALIVVADGVCSRCNSGVVADDVCGTSAFSLDNATRFLLRLPVSGSKAGRYF